MLQKKSAIWPGADEKPETPLAWRPILSIMHRIGV